MHAVHVVPEVKITQFVERGWFVWVGTRRSWKLDTLKSCPSHHLVTTIFVSIWCVDIHVASLKRKQNGSLSRKKEEATDVKKIFISIGYVLFAYLYKKTVEHFLTIFWQKTFLTKLIFFFWQKLSCFSFICSFIRNFFGEYLRWIFLVNIFVNISVWLSRQF